MAVINPHSSSDDTETRSMDLGPFLRQEGRSPAMPELRPPTERRVHPAYGAGRALTRPSLYDVPVTMRPRPAPARPVTLWMAWLVRQIRQAD